jgi:hypothetical protein
MADADILPPDVRAEIERFDARAQEIIVSFVGPLESQPPPPTIYHYTNEAGLRGILESGMIWLTDIFDLNDPSELSHGFSQAVSIMDAWAADGPPESKLFAKQFSAFGTQGGIQASAHYFVGSFSADGDDLGQWRAYADNGRGYALEFDAKVLETGYTKAGDGPIPSNSTFRVTYADAQLAELHRQMIEAAFPLISLPRCRTMTSEVMHAYMGELLVLLAMHAMRAVLFFKHEAYRKEQEYRFLQVHRADVPPPEVKVRARASSSVRYKEFDWRTAAPGALRRIVIGPAADPENAAQFASDCLASFHSEAVEVVRSGIPYRAT